MACIWLKPHCIFLRNFAAASLFRSMPLTSPKLISGCQSQKLQIASVKAIKDLTSILLRLTFDCYWKVRILHIQIHTYIWTLNILFTCLKDHIFCRLSHITANQLEFIYILHTGLLSIVALMHCCIDAIVLLMHNSLLPFLCFTYTIMILLLVS